MRYIFAILILLSGCQFAFAQKDAPTVDAVKYFDENKRWYNDFTEHWFNFFDIPEDEVRSAIIHWEQIGEDLKNSINRAEGTYGNGGDTRGTYLRWSEKSGFVWLDVNKCNGGPMKITRGTVAVTTSSVRFLPEKTVAASFEQKDRQSNQMKAEFLFVKWREADFLIGSGNITDFADYTAGLNASTSGFLEGGSWYFSKVRQKYIGSVNELPVFPVGYEKYVKKPFRATIVSIGKTFRRAKVLSSDNEYDDEYEKKIVQNFDDLVTEVKIDIEKFSGIAPETFIRFVNENGDYNFDGITVKRVFGKYAIAEYTRSVPKPSCKKDDYTNCEADVGTTLKVGRKLSTTGEW